MYTPLALCRGSQMITAVGFQASSCSLKVKGEYNTGRYCIIPSVSVEVPVVTCMLILDSK